LDAYKNLRRKAWQPPSAKVPGRGTEKAAMAWILSTLWSELRSALSPTAQSRPSRFPVDGTPPADGQKRFYSLTIEVLPDEADTETLKLFSDLEDSGLEIVLNLPAGCKLRRCMEMSPEVAQVLIRM
jgi:hypothetical protein